MSLPHFLIVGAMKAGSTSLFRWLEEHPGVRAPAEKEPNFFGDDARWRRGVGWYESLFPSLDPGQLTGEASVAYTDPAVAEVAARRAKEVVGSARLVFIARDPVERARSHYRHEVQRGREQRTFAEAMRAGGDRYLRVSLYHRGLEPWLRHFGEDRLYLASFDALTGASDDEWRRILAFLGLASMPRPTSTHNVTETKRTFSPLMRRLYDLGAARYEKRIPRWARKALRPVLLRRGGRARQLLDSSRGAPVPPELVNLMLDDLSRLTARFPAAAVLSEFRAGV